MTIELRIHYWAITTVASLALCITDARSQQTEQPAAAPIGLEEIVVTARYKQENLQTTPIAITAVNADQIEARGMNGVLDVASAVPNVVLSDQGGGFGKGVVAFIRGVGQFDPIPAYEPGIGMYIDDVYYGTLLGSEFGLGDVSSVEVLRGPQGTLFGKNSEGGAIRIYSTEPKGDDSGYVEAGYGSYNRRLFRGAYDMPIIDNKLFLRFSFGSDNSDGFLSRYDYVCENPGVAGQGSIGLRPSTYGPGCKLGDEGGTDVQTLRVAAKLLATEDLTINLAGDITWDNSEAAADLPLAINPNIPGLAAYNKYFVVPAYGIPIDGRFVPPAGQYSTYATFCNPGNKYCIDPTETANGKGLVGKINWHAPANIDVTSITAYRESDGHTAQDFGGGPIPLNMQNYYDEHTQFTQELRVGGKVLDDKLEWTAGVYYYRADTTYTGNFDFEGLFIAPPGAFGPGTPAAESWNEGINDIARVANESGFVHGVYHFTDQLSLELGARYSVDDKSYTFDRTNLPTIYNFDPAFPVGELTFPVTTAYAHDKRTDPKIGLQYQWTPELMTYVQYATGYKGGGINPRPSSAATVLPFGVEVVHDYEGGMKSQWFDNRLRVNGAVFYYNYENLQETVTLPGTIDAVTQNAGHAIVRGAELEVETQPVHALLINTSLGYTHFAYGYLGSAALTPANGGGISPGMVAPYTPEWTADAGVQYAIDTPTYGTFTPRLDYNYRSLIYFDPQNLPGIGSQGGYGLMNAHLAYLSPDGKWQITAEGKNLFDKEYFLFKFDKTYSAVGYLSGQPGMPRTYLLSVRRNF